MSFAELLVTADVAVRGQLGGPVTFTPGTGAPVVVQGIFDAVYVRVDAGPPGMSSSGPAVFLTLADLPAGAENDTNATITVAGVAFSPWEVAPDGMGGCTFHLHKVV